MIENSETTHRNFFKLLKNIYTNESSRNTLEIEDIEVPVGTIIKNVDYHN